MKVKALLLNYLNQRILFFETGDDQQLTQINASTAKLQTDPWSVVRTEAVEQPGPVVTLTVSGINHVFNSRGYTRAAWWNRIPVSAWALVAAIAVCANMLAGLFARTHKARPVLLLTIPLVVSVAFLLIADIDCPRGGLIRVYPQNLLSIYQSLNER